MFDISHNHIGIDRTSIENKQKIINLEKLKEYKRLKAIADEKAKNPKAAGKKGKDKKGDKKGKGKKGKAEE